MLSISKIQPPCVCPYCGHKSHFMKRIGQVQPVLLESGVEGAGPRYVECLWCGSNDRDRLVYLYLKHHTNILTREGLSVLHIAPELCLSKKLRRLKTVRYVAADKQISRYWYIPGMITIDLTDTRLDAESFDLVICNHVLEHIPDDKKAMSEIFRVLRPGGQAILQVPLATHNIATLEGTTLLSEEQNLKLYGQRDHVRLYGMDYPDRLSEAGFRVEKLQIGNLYPENGVNEKEWLFVAHK